MTLNKIIFYILISFSANAFSANPDLSLFVQALKNGDASKPVPNNPEFDKWISQIKTSTHDTGEIVIHAYRFKKFSQQSTCGRVGYELEQPSTNSRFPEIGGQLNICQNGEPPLMLCKNQIRQLIPANKTCDDGSKPIFTNEVQDAIDNAIKGGSLSKDQIDLKLKGNSSPLIPDRK